MLPSKRVTAAVILPTFSCAPAMIAHRSTHPSYRGGGQAEGRKEKQTQKGRPMFRKDGERGERWRKEKSKENSTCKEKRRK